jgi:glycosyltransferase involved in cell wall biosynthesis
MKEIGLPVTFLKTTSLGLMKEILLLRRLYSREDIFIVMSPSQILVPIIRFFLGRNVILDAGWSLFEGTVISRNRFGLFGCNAVKNYLIDFTASHLARKVILESEAQKHFYKKVFFISKQKCYVLYTGIEEAAFYINRDYLKPKDLFNNKKIILFRGKFNPEAGMEILSEATKLLSSEKITFWVFCPGLPSSIHFSSNTIVSRDLLSKSEIASIQTACTMSLGQLANHSRLKRTIPHKAFEAAYLASPYLSARNEGVLELFTEGKDIECFTPGDPSDLAKKIMNLIYNSDKLCSMSTEIYSTYNNLISQSKLTNQFLQIIGP